MGNWKEESVLLCPNISGAADSRGSAAVPLTWAMGARLSSAASATATAFLFPILLFDIGTQALLYILVGTSVLGALVTWLFRIETKGVKLDTVGVALE